MSDQGPGGACARLGPFVMGILARRNDPLPAWVTISASELRVDEDAVKPSHIGKYEIQRRLGTGGMGSLYLARDPGLERLVAIKMLKDEFEDDRELRERFTREARSVARLRHRNIIVVYEIGEARGTSLHGDGVHRR